jgi:hypothetical protein
MAVLAEAADRAMSSLSPKPWRLRARAGGVDLLADWQNLQDEHPQRRDIHLACGAALFNLRLAATHLSVHPDVTIFPKPGEPELLARLSGGPPEGPSASDESLWLALSAREPTATVTHPLMPRALLDQLAAIAVREGAALVGVEDGPRLEALDGLMREVGTPRSTRPHPAGAEGSALAVALLVTADDAPLDWIQAGQALQHLLLTATTMWLRADVHTRVLGVPRVRSRVRQELSPGRHPQVVLELGQRDTIET